MYRKEHYIYSSILSAPLCFLEVQMQVSGRTVFPAKDSRGEFSLASLSFWQPRCFLEQHVAFSPSLAVATLQMPRSHMWLLATVLNHTGRNASAAFKALWDSAALEHSPNKSGILPAGHQATKSPAASYFLSRKVNIYFPLSPWESLIHFGMWWYWPLCLGQTHPLWTDRWPPPPSWPLAQNPKAAFTDKFFGNEQWRCLSS